MISIFLKKLVIQDEIFDKFLDSFENYTSKSQLVLWFYNNH